MFTVWFDKLKCDLPDYYLNKNVTYVDSAAVNAYVGLYDDMIFAFKSYKENNTFKSKHFQGL